MHFHTAFAYTSDQSSVKDANGENSAVPSSSACVQLTYLLHFGLKLFHTETLLDNEGDTMHILGTNRTLCLSTAAMPAAIAQTPTGHT